MKEPSCNVFETKWYLCKTGLFFILLTTLLSCGSETNDNQHRMAAVEDDIMEETELMEQEAPAPVTRQKSPDEDQLTPETEKKIIKEGSITLEVERLEKAKANTDSLLRKFNGYYASENFSNTGNALIYNLTLRLPADNFDGFIALLEKGEDEIVHKSIHARDVTTEYIDLKTRLENKQEYLIRYREILQKANSVKEILEIQEKIRVIEEEVESVKGRLKYLNNQVSYSTLNLTLRKEKEYTYKPEARNNFGTRLITSLSKGWYAFVDFILFLLRLWPFLLLIAIGIPAFQKWKKSRKRKKTDRN